MCLGRHSARQRGSLTASVCLRKHYPISDNGCNNDAMTYGTVIIIGWMKITMAGAGNGRCERGKWRATCAQLRRRKSVMVRGLELGCFCLWNWDFLPDMCDCRGEGCLIMCRGNFLIELFAWFFQSAGIVREFYQSGGFINDGALSCFIRVKLYAFYYFVLVSNVRDKTNMLRFFIIKKYRIFFKNRCLKKARLKLIFLKKFLFLFF